jgi:hypothetical protein
MSGRVAGFWSRGGMISGRAPFGYAVFHPVAGNDRAEGRSENRRVNIIVLPHITSPFPIPAPVRVPAERAMMKKDGPGINANAARAR